MFRKTQRTERIRKMPDCTCNSHGGFLTAKGLKEAAQRSLEGLEVDGMDVSPYLDKVGSVSGLELERDLYAFVSDTQIDQQYRRFLNGY